MLTCAGMDILERKKIFAKALFLEPNNLFQAAMEAWGGDAGEACRHTLLWKNDPEVVKFLSELRTKSDPVDTIADKVETSLLAWRLANDEDVKPYERISALRLYAEINEFISKKESKANAQVNVQTNKVMLVKDHGNDEDWEQKVALQQAKLIGEA